MPVIPANQEAEAGEWLEPGRWRLQTELYRSLFGQLHPPDEGHGDRHRPPPTPSGTLAGIAAHPDGENQ
ncbi:hypothetical protein AAY473_032446 [Plecturocebus cupreus]